LFPNSKGESLEKQALHNGLARLFSRPAAYNLTPELVRQAFLQLEAEK